MFTRAKCRRWVMVSLYFIAMAVPGDFEATAEQGQTTQATRLKGRELERDAAQFLERYRQFLNCCAASLEFLDRVEILESQGSSLLARARAEIASELHKLRTFTVHELMAPVERARDDLGAIRKRMEQIQEAEKRLEERELDFFTFWTERGKIREALEAIPREFHAPERPAGPPTGMEIGVTPPMGPEIGTVPPTGPAIGTVPPTGREIGITPPTGKDIGVTPPTGPAIGVTPPTGPAIGESPRQRSSHNPPPSTKD